MKDSRKANLLVILLVLSLAATVIAHDHDEHKKHKEHKQHKEGHHSMNMNAIVNATSFLKFDGKAESYWRLEEGKIMLYSHVLLMIVDWVMVLPVSVMFAVAQSSLHAPVQIAFLALNAVGIFCGVVYNKQTPNLYPNNVHSKLGWIVVLVLIAHSAVGILFRRSLTKTLYDGNKEERSAFIPGPMYKQMFRSDRHARANSCSNDSAHGGSDAGSTTNSPLRSPFLDQIGPYFKNEEEDEFVSPKVGQQSKWLILLNKYIPKRNHSVKTNRVINLFYQIVQRSLLLWMLLLVCTGIVVVCGIARGSNVFNILAHFIKGGIFFTYGCFTLARYFGVGADIGWAWNIKPPRSVVSGWSSTIRSVEFCESAVIFTYGILNIWLEHLAAWGEAWTVMDLEHVAISFMFIGGGLLGMLTESISLRGLFANLVYMPSELDELKEHQEHKAKNIHWNYNPVPALVFFILGIMMGGHSQEHMLGAMIHKQWGTLLSAFAVFRCITYFMLYLNPPKSYLPTQPFTEILASFCLICGGMVFMASNKDTIQFFMDVGIDAMFNLTIFVGLTALLMSWEVMVLALKAWAVRREGLRRQAMESTSFT